MVRARCCESSPQRHDVSETLLARRLEFLRFVERRVGRRDLAEDILQSAFVRGLEKLEKLRDDDAVVAWFYRALQNAVTDHFRQRRSMERSVARFAEQIETVEHPPETMPAGVCRCVTPLIDGLKPEHAQALRRIELDGVSVKSFAEEQGISRSNAAVRVFRARAELRRRLRSSCGSCAEDGCRSCTCDAAVARVPPPPSAPSA